MFGKSPLFALALSLFFFLSAGASAQTCSDRSDHKAVVCENASIDESTPTETSPAPEAGSWALMLTGSGIAGAVLRRRRARDTNPARS